MAKQKQSLSEQMIRSRLKSELGILAMYEQNLSTMENRYQEAKAKAQDSARKVLRLQEWLENLRQQKK